MNDSGQPREWSILLNGMADETLTADQERQLVLLLQTDQEFLREYVRFCQLLTSLTWQAETTSEDTAPARAALQNPDVPGAATIGRTRRRTWLSLAVATLSVLALIGIVRLWLSPAGNIAPGTVTDITGELILTRAGSPPVRTGAEIPGQTSWPVLNGDRLQTEPDSSAVLTLSDRTRVGILPETQVTLQAGTGTSLLMDAGSLVAQVTPQRPGQALLFATPQAQVRVIGTELELFASAKQTEVLVSEGRVQVTRPSDAASAEVGQSQFLQIDETGDLSVRDIARAPEIWSEDFEPGPPTLWTGNRVHVGLPEGSRGGMAAVPVSYPHGVMRDVASPVNDEGLFAWHPDSVLHVTYQIPPPGWFHIYLHVRASDARRSEREYCCVKPALWQASSGQWQTASIPLAEFHPVSPGPDQPKLGRIATRIIFSGQAGITGVVIDHLRVDRSRRTSPGSVQTD